MTPTPMSEIVRILTSLMALFAQLLTQLPPPPPLPTQIPPRPTATATAIIKPSNTPLPASTPTAANTPTAVSTPTATRTATQAATATREVVRDASDPTGYLVVGEPPKQKLASAVLIYPLISAKPTEETIVEVMNVSGGMVTAHCHYVSTTNCRGTDFNIRLTAQQPLSWTASTGKNSSGTRIAPPLNGEAELKCFVTPSSTAVTAYNTLTGRAIISDSTGQTIGYTASGFRRLSPGSFSGTVRLDGVAYEQCADRLHFHALAGTSSSDSELILSPCEEDLLRLSSTNSAVQFAVINEYEQQFSGSTALKCFSRQRFSQIPALRRSTTGTDTIHAIVRSVDIPVIGMVIDRFTVPGSNKPSTSANTPYFEGGRSATITVPDDEF